MTTTETAPLPPLNALLLARALFKRPRPQAAAGELRTRYTAARIDTARPRRYNAAFGFGGDALPVTFYYLLAQRAHLATMLDRRFPFRIAGLIHAGNDIREHRRADPDRPIVISTSVTVQPPRPNGAVHVVLDTGAAQNGEPVFTCASDYVAVRGARSQHAAAALEQPQGTEIARWTVGPSAGRDYAAISGDWNPIHLWPWSARLMGLRGPIIHGMHTVAKACAVLEHERGARLSAISARFRSPVPLPGEVRLFASAENSSYSAVCNGRVAVEGEFGIEGP